MEKRILLGYFRWKTNSPLIKDSGKIKVWLRIATGVNGSYFIEAFFTDAWTYLEPIGAIISNLPVRAINKSFDRNHYLKYRLFYYCGNDLNANELIKGLRKFWYFKVKTKLVYVKFEPRFKLDDVVLKTIMRMI